jgi:hypothetical protein
MSLSEPLNKKKEMWNWEMKNPSWKKALKFLCHALFQAPHFIFISLFKLSHLNSHTEPSPIALRFLWYVCMFFFRFYFYCCVISKAFSNFFSISIRELFFSSRIFLFKCALCICMYVVWFKWTNNFSSLFLLCLSLSEKFEILFFLLLLVVAVVIFFPFWSKQPGKIKLFILLEN